MISEEISYRKRNLKNLIMEFIETLNELVSVLAICSLVYGMDAYYYWAHENYGTHDAVQDTLLCVLGSLYSPKSQAGSI
jgi:hypothetical protein